MSQNISTAVMQRRAPAPDALDYFPTPPWATRALTEFLASIGHDIAGQSCWEPACGEMHMARPLAEAFAQVRASDVHQYGDNDVADFLFQRERASVDWVITNPPFVLANEFVEAGLQAARIGCAMLVRSAFLEGDKRHKTLFGPNPPAYVLQFVERCCMFKGRVIRAGALDPFNLDEETGDPRKASSATAYCWLVWIHGETDTRLRWLADCRARLERDGDYPAYAEQWAAIAKDEQVSLFESA